MKTEEERVENRMSAVNLAESLAQTYMADSEEAKGFLDMINVFIVKSEIRDKGYMIVDSLTCNHVSRPRTNSVDDYASLYFGGTINMDGVNSELSKDSEKSYTISWSYYYDALEDSERWKKAENACNKRVETFSDNEKKVENAINEAKKNTKGFWFDANALSIINEAISAKTLIQKTSWREMSSLLQ